MGWIADLLKEIPSAARYKAELEDMEKENSILKSENGVLKSQIIELRQEIQRRDDVIQNEKSHDALLDEVKVKILLFLAAQREPMVADRISQAIKVDIQIVLFHLKELTHEKMVNDLLNMISPTSWLLAHEGRRYLIEHKLIS